MPKSGRCNKAGKVSEILPWTNVPEREAQILFTRVKGLLSEIDQGIHPVCKRFIGVGWRELFTDVRFVEIGRDFTGYV